MSDSLPATALSRESVAALLVRDRARYLSRLRRRLRGKLGAILDLDDVMSSAFRRVDDLCVRRALRACSPGELSVLTLSIALNIALARARTRLARVAQLTEVPELPAGGTTAAFDELENEALIMHMAGSLVRAPDLELLLLKLRGLYDEDIASASGTTAGAVRKRWDRLCRDLRGRFADPRGVGTVSQRGADPAETVA